MARHTSDFGRPDRLLAGSRQFDVATFASDTSKEHRGRHGRNSTASRPGIETALGRMSHLVAGGAFGLRCPFIRMQRFSMPDLEVTVEAIDLAFGHMHPMQHVGFLIAIKPCRIIVTGETPFTRHSPVLRTQATRVTPLALHVISLYIRVVKLQHPLFNNLFRYAVTQRAATCFDCILALEVAKDTG